MAATLFSGRYMEMSKQYLTELYRIALIEHKLGLSGAIDELARITKTATVLYGFEFADSLREVKIS